jgi:hypothetical protein
MTTKGEIIEAVQDVDAHVKSLRDIYVAQMQRTLQQVADTQAIMRGHIATMKDADPRLHTAAATIDLLRGLLRELEWQQYESTERDCPICGNRRKFGHAPDCRLMLALGSPRLTT